MNANDRLRALQHLGMSDGEAAFAQQIAFVQPWLPLPEPEYHFARHLRTAPSARYPTGRARQWRFDWAWPEQMLAVEIEGNGAGGHVGRHRSWDGFRTDAQKYNTAAALGWRVLRFTTDQVEAMEAYEAVRRWFDQPSARSL